jgi:N-acetylmuramoyl-L-alanine amidase
MILTTAVMCLAMNVYFEARSESAFGQLAVAQVTMNRASHDPKNVCKVVTARRQFSWTIDKLKLRHGHYVLTVEDEPKNKKAWLMAQTIAKMTLIGRSYDFLKGATFYHTKGVNPKWNRHMILVAVYGNHRFYRT